MQLLCFTILLPIVAKCFKTSSSLEKVTETRSRRQSSSVYEEETSLPHVEDDKEVEDDGSADNAEYYSYYTNDEYGNAYGTYTYGQYDYAFRSGPNGKVKFQRKAGTEAQWRKASETKGEQETYIYTQEYKVEVGGGKKKKKVAAGGGGKKKVQKIKIKTLTEQPVFKAKFVQQTPATPTPTPPSPPPTTPPPKCECPEPAGYEYIPLMEYVTEPRLESVPVIQQTYIPAWHYAQP